MNAVPPEGDRRRNGVRGKLRRCILRKRGRVDGVDVRKIELDRDIVMATMAIVILFLGLLLAFTLYQQKLLGDAQDDINSSTAKIKNNQINIFKSQVSLARLEKRDRINSYQTAYRFCSRINIDRAAIHWLAVNQIKALAGRKSKKRIGRFAKRYQRRLESRGGMPILDCMPNVTGGPARYLPPSEQRKFVRRWVKHQLTPAEIGICRIRIGTLESPKICLK